jgi:hypothetical protein
MGRARTRTEAEQLPNRRALLPYQDRSETKQMVESGSPITHPKRASSVRFECCSTLVNTAAQNGKRYNPAGTDGGIGNRKCENRSDRKLEWAPRGGQGRT